MFQWLENIWNLRKIFDKYLPMLREVYEVYRNVKQLPRAVERLSKENEAFRIRLMDVESTLSSMNMEDNNVEKD